MQFIINYLQKFFGLYKKKIFHPFFEIFNVNCTSFSKLDYVLLIKPYMTIFIWFAGFVSFS